MVKFLLAFVSVAVLVAVVSATDAGPINDYCVADLKSTLLINGLVCKSPAAVTSKDFVFQAFRANADTKNALGIGLIPGFAGVNYPALNTLGLSLAKINYAKGGLVPPHTHPRATEVITVLSGSVYVGFVDTSGKLFDATLYKDDFFVFPLGLVHFILNTGSEPAVTLSVLSAQNPGLQIVATALFASAPPVPTAVLTKAFGISASTVAKIEKGFKA